MKKLLVICVSLLLISLFCFAEQGEDPVYLFKKANRLYEQSLYEDAIVGYEEIIKQGLESGNLYYNLGNCYFKKGRLGKAILNYERAKLLIPNDSDLKSNYEYARSQLEEKPLEFTKIWFVRFLDKLSEQLGINGLTIFLSILYIALCIIFIIRLFFPGSRKLSYYLIAILAVSFALGAVSLRNKIIKLKKEAIIVTEDAESKFEPQDSATTHFILVQASRVEVLESKNGWSKIRRGDGKVGWIKNSTLELISN